MALMFPLRFVDHMDSGTILTNGDQIAEEGQRGRQDSFQRDASKHKGRVTLPNRMNFRRSSKGGGSFKIFIADFGPLLRAFYGRFPK